MDSLSVGGSRGCECENLRCQWSFGPDDFCRIQTYRILPYTGTGSPLGWTERDRRACCKWCLFFTVRSGRLFCNAADPGIEMRVIHNCLSAKSTSFVMIRDSDNSGQTQYTRNCAKTKTILLLRNTYPSKVYLFVVMLFIACPRKS